jgi:hypothetical protein
MVDSPIWVGGVLETFRVTVINCETLRTPGAPKNRIIIIVLYAQSVGQ